PILSLGAWSIEPTSDGAVWEVVGPGGTRVALKGGNGSIYNSGYNQMPNCWTFLRPSAAGRPPRLVIGHQWGASLYELRPGDVRLVRVMGGHEGAVMSVAPSADGRLLLTGGRDQTLCCFSLVDLPAGNEMGALFAVKGGKLVVTQSDNG